MTRAARFKLTILVVGLVFALGGVVFRVRTNTVYAALTEDTQLLGELEQKPDRVSGELLTGKGIEYQVIEGTRVVFSSSGDLPTPTIIQVQNKVWDNVLPEQISDSISSIRPYIRLIQMRPYVVLPVFPSDSAEKGYILYHPIL